MLKRIALFTLAVVMLLSLAACGGAKGSEDAISIGKNAISVADRYLDGNMTADAARDKLEDLLDRMDYLDDMSAEDEWYYEDHLIRSYISSLDTYILIDDYGKIESVRNDLASKVGENKR